jgi:hypothetical protein
VSHADVNGNAPTTKGATVPGGILERLLETVTRPQSTDQLLILLLDRECSTDDDTTTANLTRTHEMKDSPTSAIRMVTGGRARFRYGVPARFPRPGRLGPPR